MTDPRADIVRMLVQDGWQHTPHPRMHFRLTRENETMELLLKGKTFPYLRHTSRRPDGTYSLERNGGLWDALPQATYKARTIHMEDGFYLAAEGCRTLGGVMVQVHLHHERGLTGNGVPYNCWGLTASMPLELTHLVWCWINEDEEEGSTGPLIDALQDLRHQQEAQARS